MGARLNRSGVFGLLDLQNLGDEHAHGKNCRDVSHKIREHTMGPPVDLTFSSNGFAASNMCNPVARRTGRALRMMIAFTGPDPSSRLLLARSLLARLLLAQFPISRPGSAAAFPGVPGWVPGWVPKVWWNLFADC